MAGIAGWVRNAEVRTHRRDIDMTVETVLYVTYQDGGVGRFSFTVDEILMSSGEALLEWLKAVSREVAYRAEAVMPRPMTAAEARILEEERNRYLRQLIQAAPPMVVNVDAIAREFFGGEFALNTAQGVAANDRARDLFRSVAGEEAYEALERGEPWPITGSLGTRYLLHKKSSYCVERVSDGAKLCAVVPGVPLWDHLLGIKLMVERDEPAFLKTANVARAPAYL